MTHHLLHWEHVLRRAGHRITRQRAVILDAVCAGGGHKAIDEILAAVGRQDPTVDRSTVYRTLRLFVHLGLVIEAQIPGEETRYEIKQLQPHHHLVCQQCGAEREVENDALQAMITEIYQRHRFRVTNDHLLLYGVCGVCG